MNNVKTKMVTVKAYEITTPKFANDRQHEGVYDHELIDTLFKSMMKLDKASRKCTSDTMSINLGDYSNSMSKNIVQGYFLTASHGLERNEINIETQEQVGVIPHNHGIENKVFFAIDTVKGVIFVAEDLNRVFAIQRLKSLLYQNRELAYPYIDEYNEINKGAGSPNRIHKRTMYRILSLPPIDFFKALEEFESIKSARLYLDEEKDKSTVDVSAVLDSELLDNGIDEYGLEVKIINKSPKGLVTTFKKYFEKVVELQKYDYYAVEGKKSNGKTKILTPDTLTKEFTINDVRISASGIFNEDDIYDGMRDIIKRFSLLENKGPTPDSNLVGDNENVERAIQEIVNTRNKDSKSETKEG